jgi:hypothetical protein
MEDPETLRALAEDEERLLEEEQGGGGGDVPPPVFFCSIQLRRTNWW